MKLKRIIVFVLCAVMSLSFFGCSEVDLPSLQGGGTSSGGAGQCQVTFKLAAADVDAGAKFADGKTAPLKRDVKVNTVLGELPEVTYPGRSLVGWFDGETAYRATTIVRKNVTLTAKWEDAAALAEYESKIKNWAKRDHLYIHYKRYKHVASEEVAPPTTGTGSGAPLYNSAIKSTVYGDWGLWAWPKTNTNGRLFNAAWIDSSGAVYDIDLNGEYKDAGWDPIKCTSKNVEISFKYKNNTLVGLQLHSIKTRTDKSGFWKHDGGDNYVDISKIVRTDTGDCHWFVVEGDVGNGKKEYSANEVIESPYANDPDGKLNATKKTGTDIIEDSSADNSGKYPLKKLDNFDSVNGYQIFIASFNDSNGDGIGDIRGIIDKLDYLEKLNIDTLWLTPFQTSTNYHGYDINDYYSVDPRWGTTDDYKELVKKAHGKKMRVVMDFVLNHTSPANPWFVKSQKLAKEQNVTLFGKTYPEVDYRQFYSWITKEQYDKLSESEKTHWYGDSYNYYFYSSFSSTQPELNFDYQPVRDAILDVCDYWMTESRSGVKLDGFRLDAVKHIYMCNEVKGKYGNSYNANDEFKIKTGNGSNLTNPINFAYTADDDARFNYDAKRNLNFYREFNYRLKEKHPTAFVVGENLDGWDQRMAPFYSGIDSQFDFGLYYNIPRGLLKAAGLPDGKFGDNFNTPYNRFYRGNSAYYKYNDGYVGGQFTSNHDLPRARDRMNISYADEDGDKYGAFYTNGSIDGEKHLYEEEYNPPPDTKVEKIHNQITTTGTIDTQKVADSTAMLKLYYAALMTLPGVTWLYYGDEIGMSGLMQHTLSVKPEFANLATSTTASGSHEDIIYRQPMKWKKATTAAYDDAANKSHGNSAFKIGFGDILCELVGINATDSIPSVEESTNDDGTFKNGSLLDWVAKLNKMRKDIGLTKMGGDNNKTVIKEENGYTVQGTKGKIRIKFATADPSGNAYDGLSFKGTYKGKTVSVIITKI